MDHVIFSQIGVVYKLASVPTGAINMNLWPGAKYWT